MKITNNRKTPIRRIKGINGTISMYEDRAVLNHKGVIGVATQGIKGETTLFYSNISAIDYKKPGLTHGYIRFVVPGTVVANSKSGLNGWGTNPMKRDPNAVLFKAYHNRSGAVKDMYTALMEKVNFAKQQPVPGTSVADELEKFSELLAQGAITQEEYDAAKKKLLGA